MGQGVRSSDAFLWGSAPSKADLPPTAAKTRDRACSQWAHTPADDPFACTVYKDCVTQRYYL